MARTKASVGSKISSAKSSKARCSVAPTSSSGTGTSSSEKARGSSGGNPVCPRETPKWQKPITTFFINKGGNSESNNSDEENAGPSTAPTKHKRNIIESDEEYDSDTPKNQELDESIPLEPLTGDKCHKINEFYRNKENIKRNSLKRNADDAVESVSKKVRVSSELD